MKANLCRYVSVTKKSYNGNNKNGGGTYLQFQINFPEPTAFFSR